MVRAASVMAVCLFFFVAEAVAGTYGSVDRTFGGVRFSVDISVGYWSDHDAEAKEFAEREKAATRELDGRRAELEEMVRHYRSGKHAYAQRRGLLAAKANPSGAKARLELPGQPTENVRSSGPVS